MIHRFTTLNGIKREAKQLKQLMGITHSEALENIAKSDGYSNYKEARVKLRKSQLEYKITIRHAWLEEYGANKGGLVEASVFVSSPPSYFLNHRNRKGMRSHLRKVRNEEIYCFDVPTIGEDSAKQFTGEVIRSLQFSNITGLLPIASRSKYEKVGYRSPLWGDHSLMWEDPISGDIMLSEEPYPNELVEHGSEREEWARYHFYDVADCIWGSVYSEWTEMVMITSSASSIDLQKILKSLKLGAKPIYL